MSYSHPDIQHLLAAPPSGHIWLRPLHSVLPQAGGPLLQTLVGHGTWVRSVAVLPDGRVVSASEDRTLKVWDVNSGHELQTLKGIKVG